MMAATATLLAVAVLGQLTPQRGGSATRAPSSILEVTNGADGGPGSLRAAILQAAAYDGRVTIVLRTDLEGLRSPLPAIVNSRGFDIVGTGPDGPHSIDASRLLAGPVLALASSGVGVRDLLIRGAKTAAIEVRASGVEISGITLIDCATGIRVADRIDALTVEVSLFERNGVAIDATRAGRGWFLRENRFSESGTASIRLASPEGEIAGAQPVVIRNNRFAADQVSVLAVAHATRIEENDVAAARDTGLYISGGRTTVRTNRVQQAGNAGVILHQVEGAQVADNEIDHNPVGILLNAAAGVSIEDNRIHENGAGIVQVFGNAGAPNVISRNSILTSRFDGVTVVGGSPLLRANRVLGSGGAGLRIQTFVATDGSRLAAEPLLEENVIEPIGSMSIVRDLYREPRGDTPSRPQTSSSPARSQR
jgi:hypothetical protein